MHIPSIKLLGGTNQMDITLSLMQPTITNQMHQVRLDKTEFNLDNKTIYMDPNSAILGKSTYGQTRFFATTDSGVPNWH